MKNPNGYGTVVKLGGKRRRPFAPRVTIGWDDNGKQLYKYLEYFETRPEAMIALADYNRDPYDLSSKDITFAELYERYTLERFYDIEDGVKVKKPKASDSSIHIYNMAFGQSKPLHDMTFVEIRKHHMQKIIDESDKSHETKKKVKILFNQLYKLAIENDLTEKNYASFVSVGIDNTVSKRMPFTSDEIDTLWEKVNQYDFIDTILIMIYTGLRPGELVTIENENVNIEERYMRGGLKTVAGIDRVIPINKKILPLIEKRFNKDRKYLIHDISGVSNKSRYDYYKRDWDIVIKQIKMKHNPHDSRHTFATLMDNAGANKISIKRIMGHASKDITDKIYTHKDVEQLIKAIDLI